MMTHQLLKTSNRLGVISLVTGTLLTCGLAPSYAASELLKSWHPVFSLGAGASSAKVGAAQEFPILNPMTDEFYYYSGVEKSHSSGLLDIVLNAEWNLTANWMIQAGIDYNRTEPFIANGSLLQGADAQSADIFLYGYRVSTNQVLFNSKLLYTLYNKFHPYLFGGLGAAFNKAYNYNTNVPIFLTFSRNYLDNSNTAFSYALGAGIDMDITSNMRFGIGYRYTDLGKVQLGSAFIDTTPVAGTLTQSNLHANEFLAQLTWLFN